MTVNVLLVCLGNICRSPTAHAVLLNRVASRGFSKQIQVDSAGTGSWHIGKVPDARATAAGLQRGYDLSPLRARQVEPRDFEHFNYILAMDADNLRELQHQAGHYEGELARFLTYAGLEDDVPDPYYGGDAGFEHVLDLVERGSDALLDYLVDKHQL